MPLKTYSTRALPCHPPSHPSLSHSPEQKKSKKMKRRKEKRLSFLVVHRHLSLSLFLAVFRMVKAVPLLVPAPVTLATESSSWRKTCVHTALVILPCHLQKTAKLYVIVTVRLGYFMFRISNQHLVFPRLCTDFVVRTCQSL